MTRSFRSLPDLGDGATAEPVASKAFCRRECRDSCPPAFALALVSDRLFLILFACEMHLARYVCGPGRSVVRDGMIM